MKPLVSVAVLTYNSETTIHQCIDSILMQKTDFDFEIVVGDDCSKDCTQNILMDYSKRYPSKFVLLFNDTNEGISRNNNNVLSHCQGEYIAMCEGDDYWIEKNKLQRQVDFLKDNAGYGFVGSGCNELNPDGSMIINVEKDCSNQQGRWVLEGDVFKSAIVGPVTRTATICFRKAIIKLYLSCVGAGNDAVLQAILAKHSLYARWTMPMAIYRKGGVSNGNTSMEKELRYNDYLIINERLKHNLFPNDIGFNEKYFLDRGDYIRLRYAIKHKKWRYALNLKKGLRTEQYRKKKRAKYLIGPITCFLLSFIKDQNE